MSFLTCFWVLPQKEHLRSSLSPNFATLLPRAPSSSYLTTAIGPLLSTRSRWSMTSSMKPYSLASSAVIT